MLRFLTVGYIFGIVLAGFMPAQASADTPFVTGVTLNAALRNDTTSQVGFAITNGTLAPITITQLGRWVVSGNSQSHVLSIYDASGGNGATLGSPLASVTVNCAGATPGQFLYGTLSAPFVLAVGASVAIVSAETNGGDQFYDFGTGITAPFLGFQQAVYIASSTLTYAYQAYNESYGPVSFQYSSGVIAPIFTKSGTVYTTSGAQVSLTAAITNANVGDTILIPAGTFVWGAGRSSLPVNKQVTIKGAGTTSTIINLDPSAPTYSNAAIAITAPATLENLAINGPSTPGNSVTAISVSGANGWRLTNIAYNGNQTQAYFCIVNGVYGLIDSCTITGANGSAENIFVRGPTNSWQDGNSLGGTDNVFIEDCTFSGSGYVCDANSNARVVVRFCTINGTNKVDGHGLASNTPPRSVRHMEIYDNTWTTTVTFQQAFELRGGTGMVFDNTSTIQTGATLSLTLNEYGALAQWSNFGNQYQTPFNYPIPDQIGVGEDPLAAASSPMYLWNNVAGGLDWGVNSSGIPAAAITLYQTQTGNPNATFTMADIIKADRDYFKQIVGTTFNGTSGVGRGTKSQMLAITPTKLGVGFWVTDEATWNTKQGGFNGQLYVWTGSPSPSWVLAYTPYVYPNPQRYPSAPSNLQIGP